MKFYGTRDKSKLYSMKQAAQTGLAPCGGLYMPCQIPQADMKIVLEKAEQSFAEMALYLAELFFADEMTHEELRQVAYNAFDFPVELSPCGAIELFHGPTLAFKDFGARFMGRIISQIRERDMTILTATSGDTGSAVANGFLGAEGVHVVVLYPKGRISNFQERQITTLGANITALRVDGSFDDCQRMVKEIFADHEFCATKGITSANSISILRWIPQSFYYFYAYYLWLKKNGKGEPVIVVPSGNFGNITAGIMAKKMGLSVARFIAATNANDTIPRFIQSGEYNAKASIETLSNAMDVGDPSNYERLMELYGGDISALRADMSAVSFSDEQTLAAIGEIYSKYAYISDPHSAIGYLALQQSAAKGFYLATADSSKFADVIKQAVDIDIQYPERAKRFFVAKKSFTDITADSTQLKLLLQ